MRSMLKYCAALSLSLALSGCISVLPDPEPASSIYHLSSEPVSQKALANAPVIRIDTPSANRHLSGRQIAVSPDGQRMAVAAGAEWADILPNMVQQNMLDVLGARSNVIGVLPISGARSQYRIHLNIDNFEARFDQGEDSPPLVMVSYSATVANSGTRDLVDTLRVTQSIRSTSPRVSSIVTAMNEANDKALNELADWVTQLSMKPKS